MSINLTHTNDSILPDSGNLSVTGNLVVSSRLGVGTSTPTSPLTVNGNIAILSTNRLLFPDASGTTSLSGTQLNVGFNSFSITGGVSYANVISDRQIVITKAGHASDSGQKTALLIRPGSDPASLIYNPFEIQKFDNTILLSVDKQGNVGIGTGSPTSNLHVIGTANVTSDVTISNAGNIILRSTANDGKISFIASNGNEHAYISRTGSYNLLQYSYADFLFNTSAATGNVSFLTNYPTIWKTYSGSTFNFGGFTGFGGEVVMKNLSSGVEAFHAYIGDNIRTTFPSGNVGIGLTTPTSNLHVIGTANVTGNVTLSNTLTVVSTTGNVGVGTTSPSYKLQVSGSFAATTKSFVIDHPTKENHTLVYGSLEGPENGVYVRGRLQNKDTIELPDYWSALVDENSVTVQLTPIGKHQNLYVKEICNNTITVGTTGLFKKSIDCFYIVNGERKDVPKLQVEVAK